MRSSDVLPFLPTAFWPGCASYGILKVTGVDVDSVRFAVGTKGFSSTYNAAQAIRRHATKEAGFFVGEDASDELVVDRSKLDGLRTRSLLSRIVRYDD